MGKFTFRKEERLSKEIDIQELFDKGSSFYLFPFKVILTSNTQQPVHQVLISVSKRNFKRAVDRNLIKRRTREAYRLQKQQMPVEKKLRVAFIYTHKEILLFDELKRKMSQVLNRISRITAENNQIV